MLIILIEKQNVDQFYVGHQGAFDKIVKEVLEELSKKYLYIQYTVVLAYMPQKSSKANGDDWMHTMLPDGIEQVPKRFAIAHRNEWMLRQAQYVVAYVKYGWGGAAQYVQKAQRQGKMILNLAENCDAQACNEPPSGDI